MNLDPKPLTDPEPTTTEPVEPVTPPLIDISDDVVERVNGITSGDITPDHIRAVLAAANHITSGDPVGTVLRSDDGKLATRVCKNGVNMWSINHPDGGHSYDMEPTLPWTKLADPIAGL